MQPNVSRAAILELIQQIEYCRDSQDNVDRVYNSFFDTLKNEMNESVPYFDCSKPTRKRFKFFKPYWNENLEKHWIEVQLKERSFVKYRGSRERGFVLRQQFLKQV